MKNLILGSAILLLAFLVFSYEGRVQSINSDLRSMKASLAENRKDIQEILLTEDVHLIEIGKLKLKLENRKEEVEE
jgi:hypothetical protein